MKKTSSNLMIMILFGVIVSALTLQAIVYTHPEPGSQGDSGIRRYDVGADTATNITPGTAVKLQTGVIIACIAGDDVVYGVALSSCDIPTVTGDFTVLVDTNLSHTFYFIADATADVTIATIGTLVDIASATEINGNASTDDVFEVVGIDPIQSQNDTQAGFFVRLNPEERGLF